MIKILVTGASGQMGQALQSIAHQYTDVHFIFLSSKELDISKKENIIAAFEIYKPDYCCNLAAYTNVERAEEEEALAFLVNAEGCKNLAEVCLQYDGTLIHISSDFVFDGAKNTPYTLEDIPNPINVYGASKLKGEQYIQALLVKHYIVRTSWVYSEFGHNFRNTMLNLAKTKIEINVVDDQIGCPTHATDVVCFILELILKKEKFGLYHYRGKQCGSWYDFAVAIFEEEGIKIKVNRIKSEDYLTKAKRPKYSVLG
ncbi:dTDP-4-dehydrorhamnose reductase [Myroides odoratus]|uniref:dTDP-4-dehydrorhamnose reductase n=1 Tax=Myroides odoratus TaxID=256 RepID=A0A378U2A4_MYROD|nr:dTDP-4-dehydrorhamnose reductase [Myroides odoratus]MCS4239289.1 dTDP-4-dehydrorhamnose reductase [Myroides odoratus]MDH6602330.1 dTDP-4-dehydrorhamnose reductase [Myroides gitamensis]QQU03467.1 dTDP-4-dehydrorhamnose reductase [Myroides odoratus]STZ69266.1 dTDP-4-dehydrorhamnose reductase [Myroides odoratus]